MQGEARFPKLRRMFLRRNRRLKDGKTQDYWSVVENRRLAGGRVVQRQVLYLGEINASQREAWRKTIEVQDEGKGRQVTLFPAGSMPADVVRAMGVRVNELRLERPREWGACWLSCLLWQQLDLDAYDRDQLWAFYVQLTEVEQAFKELKHDMAA